MNAITVNAEYERLKEEINAVRIPRKNDFKTIEIKGEIYKIVRNSIGLEDNIDLRDEKDNMIKHFHFTGSEYTKRIYNWKPLTQTSIRRWLIAKIQEK